MGDKHPRDYGFVGLRIGLDWFKKKVKIQSQVDREWGLDVRGVGGKG